MSQFSLPVHNAVYSHLGSEVATTAYNYVPQLPEGMPENLFPYIVFGEDDTEAWDTDDTLGGRVDVTLHVWSRYQGDKEVKTIMQDIDQAFHRATLPAQTGYRFVDCLRDFSTVLPMEDGGTIRHGVCRYVVTIEKE